MSQPGAVQNGQSPAARQRPRWFVPVIVLAVVAGAASGVLAGIIQYRQPEELLADARHVVPRGFYVTQPYSQRGVLFGMLEETEAWVEAEPDSPMRAAVATAAVQRAVDKRGCRIGPGKILLGYPYLTGRCGGTDIQIDFHLVRRDDGLFDDKHVEGIRVTATNSFHQTLRAMEAASLVFLIIAAPAFYLRRRSQ
jgi:hypothetical protein